QGQRLTTETFAYNSEGQLTAHTREMERDRRECI
ncbi:MAG TPA: hypothetical protein EYP64_06715, partial [Desulfarculaceae bacterium]|nr:hypothetical protein [Desulfarculaceae bacterium]